MRSGAAAILMLLAAAPAVAQNGWVPRPGPIYVPGPIHTGAAPGSGGAWREERDVRHRIRAARDAGQITRSEARGFRREAQANAALADRLGAGGLSASEQREVDATALVLRDRLAVRRSAAR